MMHSFLIGYGLIFAVIVSLFLIFRYRRAKEFYKKTEYLNDCPFKFSLYVNDGHEFILFKLDDDTNLWCDYTMGIRSDGVYGVSNIEVKNLNGNWSRIQLKIGQSIFPIIEKVDQFEEWADRKAFHTYWSKDFIAEWDAMKEKLDNLRYLETKSQEKDKKGKK